MITREENESLTRVEGDAPMGRLMREHYWLPFALSAHLAHGAAPTPVRLLGENYIAFRAEDGRIGFLDEFCPHRRASLALARVEGNGVRCIYHGWKIEASGVVPEAPTQTIRSAPFCAHVPVHESGGLAWVWLGGIDAPPFPKLPFAGANIHAFWCRSQIPCNWLQGIEGTVDSAHVGWLHRTWLGISAQLEERANISLALAEAPGYETESTSYGGGRHGDPCGRVAGSLGRGCVGSPSPTFLAVSLS